jgi:hypothetical protein
VSQPTQQRQPRDEVRAGDHAHLARRLADGVFEGRDGELGLPELGLGLGDELADPRFAREAAREAWAPPAPPGAV